MKDIFVALVGSHPIQREGIVSILRKGGFSHLHSYDSLAELSEVSLPTGRRIVCLVDLHQEMEDLLSVVRKLRTEYPKTCIVLLAEAFDEKVVMQAVECNADGLILEQIGRDALIKSLELVVLGEKVFPANNLLHICKRNTEITATNTDANSQLETLSSREVEVLHKLTAGFPNKAIARDCGITESTVKVHVKAILRKIHAKNRTQAAVWARKFGIDHKPYLASSSQALGSTLLDQKSQNGNGSLLIQPDSK
jgi:two-component system, NarL family, nitrate/nitrite response regulator NarL